MYKMPHHPSHVERMYDMDAQDITPGQQYLVGPDPTWVDQAGRPSMSYVLKYAGHVVTVRGKDHPLWMGDNVSVHSAERDAYVYVHPRHLTPYAGPNADAALDMHEGGGTSTPRGSTVVGETGPELLHVAGPVLDVAAVVEWIRRLDGQASAFAAQRDAALRYLQRARRERDEARAAAKEAQWGWDQASEAWGQVQAVLPSQPWERASSLVQDTLDHIDALTAEVERLRAAQQLPDVGPVTRSGQWLRCGDTYLPDDMTSLDARRIGLDYLAVAAFLDAEADNTSSDDEDTDAAFVAGYEAGYAQADNGYDSKPGSALDAHRKGGYTC